MRTSPAGSAPRTLSPSGFSRGHSSSSRIAAQEQPQHPTAPVAGTPIIILADDDRGLTAHLSRQLEANGCSAIVANDGIEAKECIESVPAAMVLLDLHLPRLSGLDLLRWMKEHHPATPVIIISANSSVSSRIECLEVGADDYLVKPFEPSELCARMTAVMRRSAKEGPMILRCGGIELNLTEHKVSRNGETVTLSQREYALLEFLMRNKNQIVTRQRILQHVWGYDFPTTTNIVDVYISYLRKALDCGRDRKHIHTIHGEGFLLAEE